MTKIGVRGFYQITEEIESALLSDENVNTVTTGDITDIDLSKNSIYPISHVTINNASLEENLIRFNISLISMDLVDVSKSETTDIFVGNNNEQDVLNTQLAVVNKVVQKLRQGTLYQNKFQLDNNPTCEFFTDRFDNQVAGVAATIDIVIPNDIDICN